MQGIFDPFGAHRDRTRRLSRSRGAAGGASPKRPVSVPPHVGEKVRKLEERRMKPLSASQTPSKGLGRTAPSPSVDSY